MGDRERDGRRVRPWGRGGEGMEEWSAGGGGFPSGAGWRGYVVLLDVLKAASRVYVELGWMPEGYPVEITKREARRMLVGRPDLVGLRVDPDTGDVLVCPLGRGRGLRYGGDRWVVPRQGSGWYPGRVGGG